MGRWRRSGFHCDGRLEGAKDGRVYVDDGKGNGKRWGVRENELVFIGCEMERHGRGAGCHWDERLEGAKDDRIFIFG